jgi:hypothetical protein
MKLGQLVSQRGSRLSVAILLLIAATVWASPALAQLSGGSTYPINGTENPPVSFQSIGTAVTYMSTFGVTGSGQVVLELTTGYAGEAGYIIIPAITGTSSTLGVTFRPAAGYTAVTSIAGAASPNYVAIRILASYITLDGQGGGGGGGRDWTIRCTGSGTTGNGVSAIRFGQGTPTYNQTDVTVKYCILEAEAATTTSAIVGIDGGSTYTVKNITIANNLIRSTGVSATNCRGYGITIANASNAGNTGLVVRDNVIRDFYARGINCTGGFPGGLVYNNDIAHTSAVTQPSTTEFAGIYFSTSASGGTKFYNNFIHDIQLTNGSTAVNGIFFLSANTSGNRISVYNNRIDLGAGIAPTTLEIIGVRDDSDTGALLDYDDTSIYLGGSPAAGTVNSSAFKKLVTSASNIRDNIFHNARSNSGTATGTHWGVNLNNTTNLVSINYNDYFASGTGGVLGTTDGTTTGNKVTLAAWKAAVAADTYSISQDPYYVNPIATPPDLHLSTALASQLESGGTIISGINDDFEGTIRCGSVGYGGAGTAPDIGADECEGVPLDLYGPVITYALLLNSTSTTTRTFSNVAVTDPSGVDGTLGTRPRCYYKKSTNTNAWNDNTSATDGWKYVEANGSSLPFDFTIDYSLIYGGSVVAGDVVQYFVVAQDLAPIPNVGINSGTFAATPVSVALTSAAFPIGGTINSYSIAYSLAGTYTVGTGGTYGTLKAAFDDINAKVVTGNILLTILASGTTETASAVLNPVACEGGSWTITVKPDVSATPTITGAITGALVKLNGADYVTFDGSNTVGGTTRDLTLLNSGTSAASAVIWLSSLGTGAGAHNNTVKNCVLLGGVDQSLTATENFAIISSGAAISTTSYGADNDFNAYANNEVRKVRWGIFALGIAGNPNDGTSVAGNLIGPAGWGIDQLGLGGIAVQYQNEATIIKNEVRFLGCLYTQTGSYADRSGIAFGSTSWPATSGTTMTSCFVTQNLIHDIVDEKTGSAVGIIVAGAGTPSGNEISNNMIYGVRANGTASDQSVGLGIGDGNGDKVVFNSICLSGDLDPGSSTSTTQSGCGIRISSATPSNLTLKDNVISVDYSSNTSTLKHYTIVVPAATYPWGAGGIDNNDYYANPGNAQMVLGGIGTSVPYTAVATLAAWQATFTPNQDAFSVAAKPPFVSATDLHLIAGSVTELESGGVPIAGVLIDYDGQVRSTLTPDIGADEFAGIYGETVPPAITYALLGNSAGTTTRALANVTVTDVSGVDGNPGTRPRVYYKTSANINGWNDNTSATDGWKYAEANGSTSPFDFTIDYSLIYGGSVAVGDVIQYFVVAQDLAAIPNVGINFGSFAATPASVALTSAAFPISGTLNSYTILGSVAGEYTVGTGGTYATLKAAFDDINAKVVTGNATLKVLASGTTETASAVLNAVSYEGGPWTITVKPDAGATPTITGAITGALVKLNGADNVVFEGSNAGYRARDLTISNTGTAAASAAIWLSSAGAGAGCTNVTVRSCVLRCGADQSTGTVETFGIISSGTSISTSSYGADNDNNTFGNNDIAKVRWGIYLLGISGNPNDTNTVTGNLIGPSAFGSYQVGKGGIIIRYQNQAQVTANEVRCVGLLFSQTATTGSDRIGIGVGSDLWTPTSSTVTNSVVTGNLVHDIADERMWAAAGIVVAGSGTPSNNLIANNMIYAIHANATSPDQGVGIGIGDGNGDRVVFNSIYLSGNQDQGGGTTSNQSACGIRISSTTPANLTLKNNIVSVDVTSTTQTLMHYAIVAPSAAYVWGTGGCDHNDYYTNPANLQMVLGGLGTTVPYANVTTLAAWQATFTPSQDAASLNADPLYAGATNLHINTSGIPVSPVANAGLTVAVVTDFDGDTRSATPDIGADEFTSYTLTVHVIGGGSVTRNPDQPLYNPGTQVQLTAVARGWYFDHWSGDASGSDNPLTISMDANKDITAHFSTTTAITIDDVALNEGDSGTTDALFTVTLSETSADTVRVLFATADSSATVAGGDYVAVTDTLVFEPGDTLKTIAVPVVGDPLNEADEVFKVLLFDSVNAGVLDGLGLGTILNDDPLPTLIVDDISVTEGDAGTVAATFTITLSAPSGRVLSATCLTADDTAVAGEDYTALPATELVFNLGDPLTKQVTVLVNGDEDNEADEAFFLNLTLPVFVALADSEGICTILNDDEVSAVAEPIPTTTFLGAAYPNPLGDQATIVFGLHVPANVELRVYDLQGRMVRSLMSGGQTAGFKRVVWDGRDNGNREVGAGCYFVRMHTPQKTFERRILVVR